MIILSTSGEHWYFLMNLRHAMSSALDTFLLAFPLQWRDNMKMIYIDLHSDKCILSKWNLCEYVYIFYNLWISAIHECGDNYTKKLAISNCSLCRWKTEFNFTGFSSCDLFFPFCLKIVHETFLIFILRRWKLIKM